GTMYMYLNFRSPWRRAAFMGLAIAVPLIANGLRAYGIVMIAHLSDYKYALGIDHFIYGWVFFGIVIFALFALGNRFSDIDPDLPAPAVAPAASRATSRAAPLAPVLVALAAAAFAPPLLVHAASANRPLAPAIALPTVADWQGPRDERLDLGAERAGADQSLAGVYQAADQSVVWLTLDYFRGEGPGKELVNQAQRGFDPKRWQQLDYGVAFPAPASGVAQANAVRLRQLASGEEYLLWSWYDTNAQRSSARLAVKMAQAGARLRGGPVGGAVVTVATRVEGGADGAAVLNRFLASGAVAIERLHVAP
ncbi:MAG: exosortase C-terminal domain/associated protein EpsI, partial [Gammaproteobacteria bacterium]